MHEHDDLTDEQVIDAIGPGAEPIDDDDGLGAFRGIWFIFKVYLMFMGAGVTVYLLIEAAKWIADSISTALGYPPAH
jgi:hypothetical protein